MNRKYFPAIISIVLLPAAFLISCRTESSLKGARPNIIFIIGDDIGYSDLGCYGSEIETPNLDMMAREGIRFRQFYNMAKCNPTRSSLHTGMFYGDENAPSLGKLMSGQGYHTLFAGKEHFDPWVPEACYAAESFDMSLTHWAINNYFIQPDGWDHHPYFLNGVETDALDLPRENEEWFMSDVVTDNAIRFMKETEGSERPFFLYLAYLNAHYPLQAKKADLEKYRGRYMEGWDRLREDRFLRQKEIGLAGDRWKMAPPSSNINRFRGHPGGNPEIRDLIPGYMPWESLSDSAKEQKDLEMAAFAALVDNMDQNIGRVIDYLEASGRLENTIIIYMSDNGSCPYDSNRDFDLPPGHPYSYRTLDPKWANVGNTPFRYYKQFGHEGGANTHFIAWWPGYLPENRILQRTGHVVDVLPTLVELAGGNPEEEGYSIDGISMVPLLEGKEWNGHDFFLSGLDRFRMYREDRWKIVRVNGEAWQLFDLVNDPTETKDLAPGNDSIVERLEEGYEKYIEGKSFY